MDKIQGGMQNRAKNRFLGLRSFYLLNFLKFVLQGTDFVGFQSRIRYAHISKYKVLDIMYQALDLTQFEIFYIIKA